MAWEELEGPVEDAGLLLGRVLNDSSVRIALTHLLTLTKAHPPNTADGARQLAMAIEEELLDRDDLGETALDFLSSLHEGLLQWCSNAERGRFRRR